MSESQGVANKTYLRAAVAAFLAIAMFLAETINLESVPPLWWDEGWLLTIARTWVEQGYYGRLLVGDPVPVSPTTGFPAIAPIALSFHLLGIGIWQGRLVGVFFTLGALVLIYCLASRLYDRSVAIGTLAILLLMSSHRDLHPILVGRQALGEMPALFYLLAGYACLLWALSKPIWFLPLTMVPWSIALITKLQVLPFWAVSLLTPMLMALFRKNWRSAGLLVVALLGSLITSQLLVRLLDSFVLSQTLSLSQISETYDVTALVNLVSIRLFALKVILIVALPTLLGLCYATWKLVGDRHKEGLDVDLEVVRVALLTLATSWFAWYVLLSVGWIRYLFPATFIGSIFVAAMLWDLTDRFDFSSTIKRGGDALRCLRFNRRSAGALLSAVLIIWTPPVTILELYRSYVVDDDTSTFQVADFLNTQTAADALIETYDSELFFLLDRRYHYPPDQIHVELNRRTFLGQDLPIDYDPLAADPDYLVVGPYSRLWHLYDSVLATGAFRLLRTYSRYDVYERVR